MSSEGSPLSFGPEVNGEAVWFEIMLRCDRQSVGRMNLVCYDLYSILSTHNFWLAKCEYDGKAVPPVEWRKLVRNQQEQNKAGSDHQGTSSSAVADQDPTEFDYKSIWLHEPYNRNLAPIIDDNTTIDTLTLTRGMTLKHGGHRMIIERDLSGHDCQPPMEKVTACLTTSFDWCSRSYEIQLEDVGIEPWIMDNIRPEFVIRELCCCRRDCAAEYQLEVRLLRDDETSISCSEQVTRIQNVSKSWEQWAGGQEWEEASILIAKYPIGMRRLIVTSKGKDSQFWAGHYGSKFANLEIIARFPEDEIRFKNNTEYADPSTLKSIVCDPSVRRMNVVAEALQALIDLFPANPFDHPLHL